MVERRFIKSKRDQGDQEGELKQSTGNGKFDSKCMICVLEKCHNESVQLGHAKEIKPNKNSNNKKVPAVLNQSQKCWH